MRLNRNDSVLGRLRENEQRDDRRREDSKADQDNSEGDRRACESSCVLRHRRRVGAGLAHRSLVLAGHERQSIVNSVAGHKVARLLGTPLPPVSPRGIRLLATVAVLIFGLEVALDVQAWTVLRSLSHTAEAASRLDDQVAAFALSVRYLTVAREAPLVNYDSAIARLALRDLMVSIGGIPDPWPEHPTYEELVAYVQERLALAN